MNQSWTDETFVELKSQIEGLIEKTGVKLVVLVDDIDRVREKPDLRQKVQPVKLLGKFKNR